jgi:hypothetical protein
MRLHLPIPRESFPPMLWLATTLKLLCEIALMAMLGQWALAHLPGVVPGHNPFWRVLDWVSAPAVRLLRTRRRAALALWLLWLGATVLKVWWCLRLGAKACQ